MEYTNGRERLDGVKKNRVILLYFQLQQEHTAIHTIREKVRIFSNNFKKLKSKLFISKYINCLSYKQFIASEGQHWFNAQYSRCKRLEIAVILSSVANIHLESITTVMFSTQYRFQ